MLQCLFFLRLKKSCVSAFPKKNCCCLHIESIDVSVCEHEFSGTRLSSVGMIARASEVALPPTRTLALTLDGLNVCFKFNWFFFYIFAANAALHTNTSTQRAASFIGNAKKRIVER